MYRFLTAGTIKHIGVFTSIHEVDKIVSLLEVIHASIAKMLLIMPSRNHYLDRQTCPLTFTK